MGHVVNLGGSDPKKSAPAPAGKRAPEARGPLLDTRYLPILAALVAVLVLLAGFVAFRSVVAPTPSVLPSSDRDTADVRAPSGTDGGGNYVDPDPADRGGVRSAGSLSGDN